MTRPGSLVARAHAALAAHLGPGDTAVDATVGGGGDTLVLARAVGDSGRVHGFDVQLEALDRARRRLEQAGVGARVELHPASHADLARVLPARLRGALAAAVFNLGYLPGGDERLTTRADSTLAALHQLESWLAPDGALSLIAYVGQSGGAVEADAVEQWSRRLDPGRWSAHWVRPASPRAPRWLWLVRRAGARGRQPGRDYFSVRLT